MAVKIAQPSPTGRHADNVIVASLGSCSDHGERACSISVNSELVCRMPLTQVPGRVVKGRQHVDGDSVSGARFTQRRHQDLRDAGSNLENFPRSLIRGIAGGPDNWGQAVNTPSRRG